MESLVQGSCFAPSSSSYLLANCNNNPRFVFPNGYLPFSSSSSSSFLPFSVRTKNPRKSASSTVVVNSRKKDNKQDDHSFVSKPDETGFFPESVLLKKKTIEEDGKALPEFEDAEERELFEALMLDLESDMNVDQMRHYEIMYLIHEKHEEEEVAAVNEKVQEFMREKKGTVWRLNDWGLRRLAYKIKKARNARYILMNFELDAKYINDFKTLLDKDERVIRHLVTKRDEAITEDCPPPPEFHSLRAPNADGFDEDFYDDDDEAEMDGDDEDDDGAEIIIIDSGDDDDEGDYRNDASANVSEQDRRKLRAGNVAR